MMVYPFVNKKRANSMTRGLWFIGKETSVAVFIAFTPYTLHHTLYTLHSQFQCFQHPQWMIY